MALAVRRNEQDEFIGVPLASSWTFDGMIAKARRGLEKILGFGSALNEVADRALRGAEPVGGLQCFGSLDLVATVWNVGNDASIDLSDVAVGGRRSDHHFLDNHPPDVVLSGSDVLHTLRNRPAIRSDLEIPLRIRKTLGRIEDIFSYGFEELQGLVLVPLRAAPGQTRYRTV